MRFVTEEGAFAVVKTGADADSDLRGGFFVTDITGSVGEDVRVDLSGIASLADLQTDGGVMLFVQADGSLLYRADDFAGHAESSVKTEFVVDDAASEEKKSETKESVTEEKDKDKEQNKTEKDASGKEAEKTSADEDTKPEESAGQAATTVKEEAEETDNSAEGQMAQQDGIADGAKSVDGSQRESADSAPAADAAAGEESVVNEDGAAMTEEAASQEETSEEPSAAEDNAADKEQ